MYDIVRHLLQNYVLPNYITDAMLQLRSTIQHNGKIQEKLACLLNNYVGTCGHVHASNEVILLFVEGMNPEILSIVEALRDYNREASYL